MIKKGEDAILTNKEMNGTFSRNGNDLLNGIKISNKDGIKNSITFLFNLNEIKMKNKM